MKYSLTLRADSKLRPVSGFCLQCGQRQESSIMTVFVLVISLARRASCELFGAGLLKMTCNVLRHSKTHLNYVIYSRSNVHLCAEAKRLTKQQRKKVSYLSLITTTVIISYSFKWVARQQRLFVHSALYAKCIRSGGALLTYTLH